MKSIVSIALFVASIDALSFNPLPTPAYEDATSLQEGWTPKPTDKVGFGLGELRKRQTTSATGQLLGYNAPNNLCGYVSGNLGNPLTCDFTQSCAVVSHISSVGGLVLCCDDPNTCYWFSTCVDSATVSVSSICGDLCRNDNFVLKCTDSALPYCVGYRMSMYSASAYSCNSVRVSTFQAVVTTYNGEDESDAARWSPVYEGQAQFAVASTSTTSSSDIQSSSSSSSTSSETSATSNPSPTSPPDNGGSSTNVGAIAGGVVGGLAVVGAVICGLVWMCLRNRRRRNTPPASPGAGTGNQPPYPPMQQNSPDIDSQQWQQSPQVPVANVPYKPYNPNKRGFQSHHHPLLSADYHQSHGHSEPTSPAPQYSYSPGSDARHSTVKSGTVSPVGHDGAQEIEARPAVPNIGRDGAPVYEVQ